jgi:hypothetical protein
MDKPLSLPYFISSDSDVMFEIWDILKNADHPWHDSLKTDIGNISPPDLDAFVQKHNIDMMLGRFDDKDLARRVFYLTTHIYRVIAKEILHEISSDADRQLP